MLANVVGIALGLVRMPAIAWLLPKDEVGMIGVVASWQVFLAYLTWPSSLNAAAYHYVAKGQPSAFAYMLRHQLGRSWWSILGFLASAAYWGWQGQGTLAILFIIAGLTYPTTTILAACGEMLAAQENFVGLFWYRLGQYLANFMGFIFLLLSFWWGSRVITFYAVNQICLSVLQIGVTAWLLWRLKQTNAPPVSAQDRREIMRYGKHLTGVAGISTVQSNVDRLFVSALFPLTTMADYSIAVAVQTQFKQIVSIYISMRYPPLARMPVLTRRRRMLLEGGVIWLGFLGLGVITALLAHWLVPLIFPPSYASSLVYIDWLIAITVIGTPGGLVEFFFRTEQNARQQYIMRATSAVLTIILPLILVYHWGVYGILSGRSIAILLFSIVGLWLFFHHGRSGTHHRQFDQGHQ